VREAPSGVQRLPKADIESLKKIVPELIERANLVLAQDEKLIKEVAEYTQASYLRQSPKIWKKFLKQLQSLEANELEVSDGKSIGTFIEKLLTVLLSIEKKCVFSGSAAKGVDLPELNLGIKATSDRQPQSSEAFKSAYERIFGIENALLVFIYNGTAYSGEAEENLRCVQHYLLSETNVADRGLCGYARDVRELYREKIIGEDLLKSILRLLVVSDKSKKEFLGMARLIHEMASILGGGTKGVQFRYLDASKASDVMAYLTDTKVQHALAAAVDAYQAHFDSYPFANDGMIDGEQFKVFQEHPLDGKISLSFALQWRFQFPLDNPANTEEM
jgi:hypothetical protein